MWFVVCKYLCLLFNERMHLWPYLSRSLKFSSYNSGRHQGCVIAYWNKSDSSFATIDLKGSSCSIVCSFDFDGCYLRHYSSHVLTIYVQRLLILFQYKHYLALLLHVSIPISFLLIVFLKLAVLLYRQLENVPKCEFFI